MEDITLIVLATPGERALDQLEPPPAGVTMRLGNQASLFTDIAPRADVLLNWSCKRELVQEVFAMAPKLRWIHSRSVGLDGLLFPELVASPLPLTNSRGIFSRSLGEFVIGAALFFAKDFRRMLRSQEAGKWDRFDVEELYGTTLGIAGYGDIGRACARFAKAFGMRVLASRRQPELSADDPLVDAVYPTERRAEMMAQCDYVVAAAPLTPETLGMVGAAEIAAMKPSAVLMNVGRGPVIDEPSLIAALQAGAIRGAALDVFTNEPLPDGHPFYSMKNVLLSPHCADNTGTWVEDAMRFFLENLARFRSGQPLENLADKTRGY